MEFIDLKAQQKRIREKLEKRILSVLNHGKYIMGPEVFELEEKLSKYVNIKNCISCSSGTDALLIPLLAKNIGRGDAVLTTPFTYIATAEVISLTGATPIFVDIYEDTFNINPELITDAVDFAKSKGFRPKAIISVDLFGLPARYRLIKNKAEKHNLFILEDAAQGFGGSIRDQMAGSFGNVASTSFFPAKPLGAYGDGGAIFTNDDVLSEIMKSIRVHGSSGSDKYNNVRLGINGRLDTFQAAILIEKLRIFNTELELRKQIADYYDENINDNFRNQYIPKGYFSSRAQYSLVAQSNQHREEIMMEFQKNKIPIMIYYKIPLHLQIVFSSIGYGKGSFPVSESVAQRIFSIPMHPYLKKDDQDKIIEILNTFQN